MNKENIIKENKKENLLNMYSVGRRNGKTEELKKILEEYKKDPVKFCEEVLKVKLNKAQKELFKNMMYMYSKDKRLLINIFTSPSRMYAIKQSAIITWEILYGGYELYPGDNDIVFAIKKKEKKDKPLRVIFDDMLMPEFEFNGVGSNGR